MTRLETLRDIVALLEPTKVKLGDWKTCYAGHACGHALLQAQGLFLNDEDVPAFSVGEEHYEGFEALSVFFGLNQREVMWLFSEASYSWGDIDDLDAYGVHELFQGRLDRIIHYRRTHHGHSPSV